MYVEKSLLHEKLDTFTNDTVAKEETMLTNFLVLLNTKKEEIKRLKENGSAGIPSICGYIFLKQKDLNKSQCRDCKHCTS